MTVGPSFLSFEKPFEQERLYSQIKAQYPSATDAQVTGAITQEVASRMIEREDRFGAVTTRFHNPFGRLTVRIPPKQWERTNRGRISQFE